MSENALGIRRPLRSGATEAPGKICWNSIPPHEHSVQFYENDDKLLDTLIDFLTAGFRQEHPALIIATQNHLDGVAIRLRADGFNLEKLQSSGLYHPLNAQEVLSTFMVEGCPDQKRFDQEMIPIILKAGKKGPLRAFGEMVGVLCEQGNANAAFKLEEMWEDLQKRHAFSLFCAYLMSSFNTTEGAEGFHRICEAHTRVIPTNYRGLGTELNRENELRDLAYLEQKAAALESEIKVRKHFERRLALREHELREFLETATEGIHQVGPDGTILWANKAELEMFGYEAQEYIGHDIREFHADQAKITEILCKLQNGEKLHECESRIRHKNGSIVYVSINSSVYWDNDQFGYTRCFSRDITAQKKATEILERKVAERTVRLQETVSELEAFSYSISHDMRSPLRAINGYASSIREDYGALLPEAAIERLERIERAAIRLDQLASDILSYTRVSKQELKLHPVELTRLVREIAQQIDPGKKCEVIQGELPAVMGHEGCLNQCIANLLDNAIKFVAPGTTPVIRIDSEIAGDHVKVSVTDNGIGIAPEHHASLFKLFGRVGSPEVYAGTGLGLAIVAKAVSRMGGTVGFSSEPGKGSTFWFVLQLASGEVAGA